MKIGNECCEGPHNRHHKVWFLILCVLGLKGFKLEKEAEKVIAISISQVSKEWLHRHWQGGEGRKPAILSLTWCVVRRLRGLEDIREKEREKKRASEWRSRNRQWLCVGVGGWRDFLSFVSCEREGKKNI